MTEPSRTVAIQTVFGYTDRLSARPGERISLHVSCEGPSAYTAAIVRLHHGFDGSQGPGFLETIVPSTIDGEYPGRKYTCQPGSYVEIDDPAGLAALPDGFVVRAAIFPTLPRNDRSGTIGAYRISKSSVATGDSVPVPQQSVRLDFELEVGIVIGVAGHDVAPADGWSHVFGFTVFNDWSGRDLQGREMKVNLGPAKGKDFATTVGPVLVTADELEPRLDADGFLDLAMVVLVNGEEVGRDLLSNMGWPIGDLVAYASRDTWVQPGDLLGSGTCGNGGCLAELWGRRGGLDPRPLQPGDVVTMIVEGIGAISNQVVAGGPTPAIGAARPRPRTRPDESRVSSLLRG